MTLYISSPNLYQHPLFRKNQFLSFTGLSHVHRSCSWGGVALSKFTSTQPINIFSQALILLTEWLVRSTRREPRNNRTCAMIFVLTPQSRSGRLLIYVSALNYGGVSLVGIGEERQGFITTMYGKSDTVRNFSANSSNECRRTAYSTNHHCGNVFTHAKC